MLFDPAANLTGAELFRLRLISGAAAVGQVCCDPETFVDVPTPAGPGGPGVPLLDGRLRALLGVVWPGSVSHARLLWGARLTAHARRHGPDLAGLLPAAVCDILGVPSDVLHRIAAQEPPADAHSAATTRAALPLARLRQEIAEVVRRRATSTGRADTILDELLFWRGLGRERVTLDEVAALATALTAAAWDASQRLLARADTAARRAPTTLSWLRVTTQTVLLDGAPIPAGTHCLLTLDVAERPRRPALYTLRWLSPQAPDGAGAIFARVLAETVATARADRPGRTTHAAAA